MLCETVLSVLTCDEYVVLILVLMEDALRALEIGVENNRLLSVLILVLMEDALREPVFSSTGQRTGVLILVLMEDALRENLVY